MSENFKEIEKAVTVRDHVILALGLNFIPTDPLSHVRHESGMKIVDEVMKILEKELHLAKMNVYDECYNKVKYWGIEDSEERQKVLDYLGKKHNDHQFYALVAPTVL